MLGDDLVRVGDDVAGDEVGTLIEGVAGVCCER